MADIEQGLFNGDFDELDNRLDEMFNTSDEVNDNSDELQTVEEQTEDENTSVENQDSEEDDTSDTNTDEDAQADLSNQAKANYAFTKMRHDLKNVQNENARYRGVLEKIAQASGLNSIDEVLVGFERKLNETQAQNLGVSPEALSVIQQQQTLLKQMQMQQEQMQVRTAVNDLQGYISGLQQQYGLSQQDISNAFNFLEKQGYSSVRDLLSSPNPKMLIDYALSSRIAEVNRQAQLNGRNKPVVDTSKYTNTSSTQPTSELDEAVKDAEKWAKENGYL